MNNILGQIWRRIVMQFTDQARQAMNSKISKTMDSARDGLSGSGKKKDD